MSTTIQRPGFHEGQIIAAADLNGVVATARTALAQHERYLHSWGIATGLALTGVARKTSGGDDYMEVTLAAGMAVDGTGRHLVLAEDQRLSEETFDSLNIAINDPEAYYPVVIYGRDESKAPKSPQSRSCHSTGATRVHEQVEIGFGRVGDAAGLTTQPVPTVEAGPGDGVTAKGWRVLAGFVKWNASIKRFSAVSTNVDGVTPIYAGVRGDDVTTHTNRVTLRSGPRGANGTAALRIEDVNGGELKFGLQTTTGDVVPVFTVTAKGDVLAEGKISGAIAGGVQVQGGIAFDGALLPLPPGISGEQVDSGEVSIQAQVWPHYSIPALAPPLPAGSIWLMQPLECRVEGRRVFCRVRWRSSGGPTELDLPGACDYLLVAFAPPD